MLRTNVNNLEIAIQGRIELLGNIFGTGKKKEAPSPQKRKSIGQKFRDMARRHNLIRKGGNAGGQRNDC